MQISGEPYVNRPYLQTFLKPIPHSKVLHVVSRIIRVALHIFGAAVGLSAAFACASTGCLILPCIVLGLTADIFFKQKINRALSTMTGLFRFRIFPGSRVAWTLGLFLAVPAVWTIASFASGVALKRLLTGEWLPSSIKIESWLWRCSQVCYKSQDHLVQPS